MDATEVRRKENMPRNDSLARNPGGSPSKDNVTKNHEQRLLQLLAENQVLKR